MNKPPPQNTSFESTQKQGVGEVGLVRSLTLRVFIAITVIIIIVIIIIVIIIISVIFILPPCIHITLPLPFSANSAAQMHVQMWRGLAPGQQCRHILLDLYVLWIGVRLIGGLGLKIDA